jgi:hypothetical protein
LWQTKRELYIASQILGEKIFLDNLRESQSEAGKSATSSAPSKDYLLQARSRGYVCSENPAVHLLYGKMDAGHKEEGNKRGEGSSSCSSGTSTLKGEQKEACRYDSSILPRRPLHRGKSGIDPVSDDEPTAPGEEPFQRESRRRRNRRRNVRQHHEARERDPAQPVSRDEISEVGETPKERVFRERRNSRRRDRRQAQEQAE